MDDPPIRLVERDRALWGLQSVGKGIVVEFPAVLSMKCQGKSRKARTRNQRTDAKRNLREDNYGLRLTPI